MSPLSGVRRGLPLLGRALPWTWAWACDPVKVTDGLAAQGGNSQPFGSDRTEDVSEPALLPDVPTCGSARSGSVTSLGRFPSLFSGGCSDPTLTPTNATLAVLVPWRSEVMSRCGLGRLPAMPPIRVTVCSGGLREEPPRAPA